MKKRATTQQFILKYSLEWKFFKLNLKKINKNIFSEVEKLMQVFLVLNSNHTKRKFELAKTHNTVLMMNFCVVYYLSHSIKIFKRGFIINSHPFYLLFPTNCISSKDEQDYSVGFAKKI